MGTRAIRRSPRANATVSGRFGEAAARSAMATRARRVRRPSRPGLSVEAALMSWHDAIKSFRRSRSCAAPCAAARFVNAGASPFRQFGLRPQSARQRQTIFPQDHEREVGKKRSAQALDLIRGFGSVGERPSRSRHVKSSPPIAIERRVDALDFVTSNSVSSSRSHAGARRSNR